MSDSFDINSQNSIQSGLTNAGLQPTVAALAAVGHAYLFAGAVRDALLSARTDERVTPRDFDIGVKGLSEKDLEAFALNLGGRRNRYGGYRIQTERSVAADIWRLEDTIGLRLNGRRATVHNVLRSFVLNTNAVAVDLSTNDLFDLGALSSIRERRIDIVHDALYHSHSQFAARAILLALRLSFQLTNRLEQFVRTYFERSAFAYELAKAPDPIRTHGGGCVLYKDELAIANLQTILNRIRYCSSECANCPSE